VSPTQKTSESKMARGGAQVVERLPSKLKALSLNLTTAGKKKKSSQRMEKERKFLSIMLN
jgi:hypothetical protein